MWRAGGWLSIDLRTYGDGIAGVAAEAGAAAADEVAVAAELGEAGDELEDRRRAFHAGERVAEADVRAAAEGEVAVRLAADIEAVWLRELRGVAVGALDRHGDVV